MRKSLNRCLVGTKVNRQFSVSFALELTPGQWSRSTENWTCALGEFNQHLFRDMVPDSLGTVLFHRIQLLFGTKTIVLFKIFLHTNKRVESLPNILLNCLSCHWTCRWTSTWLEFFLWHFLVFLLIFSLSQSCNVSNPGKMFHSNFVGSPSIPSKFL